MDILFDRLPRHDRVATVAKPADDVEVVRTSYFDAVAEADADAPDAADLAEQVEYLTAEVDHLRACIDQVLDLLEAQSNLADDVDLLFDHTRLSDRRLQRIEDSLGGRGEVPRRRAEDAA